MLVWLKIKNLALVEEADIEFGKGLCVITGETGAGKSVILGSLALLLGERADKGVIRTGAERCEISAGFELDGPLRKKIAALLEEAGIEGAEEGGSLSVRRVITQSGSRNFINDAPAALQTLKALGDLLIDVHGANEHQSLLRRSAQMEALDSYGKTGGLLEKCAAACEALGKVRREREELESALPSEAEAAALRSVVADIEGVSPLPGEDKELSARFALASNSRQALDVVSASVMALTEGEGSVADRLGEIYRRLGELARHDPEKAGPLMDKCAAISEEARDLSGLLEKYAEKVELDEKAYAELEARLGALQALKRRHGPLLENVVETLESARRRLSGFDNSAKTRAELAAREEELLSELKKDCAELSAKRKKVSSSFEREVRAELRKLSFLKADFKVEFQEKEPGPDGSDRAEFLFCPNPGEPHKPLREVASSGEISRFMLALKTALAGADSVPVLVFDEIDANIGGETAAVVGRELRQLSRSHQILCISHLAQVAAHAHSHFLVEKNLTGDRTVTKISYIEGDSRTRELARMLGGGGGAMSHASELVKNIRD